MPDTPIVAKMGCFFFIFFAKKSPDRELVITSAGIANLQTYKLTNLQTYKLTNLQINKLTNDQTYK